MSYLVRYVASRLMLLIALAVVGYVALVHSHAKVPFLSGGGVGLSLPTPAPAQAVSSPQTTAVPVAPLPTLRVPSLNTLAPFSGPPAGAASAPPAGAGMGTGSVP